MKASSTIYKILHRYLNGTPGWSWKNYMVIQQRREVTVLNRDMGSLHCPKHTHKVLPIVIMLNRACVVVKSWGCFTSTMLLVHLRIILCSLRVFVSGHEYHFSERFFLNHFLGFSYWLMKLIYSIYQEILCLFAYNGNPMYSLTPTSNMKLKYLKLNSKNKQQPNCT